MLCLAPWSAMVGEVGRCCLAYFLPLRPPFGAGRMTKKPQALRVRIGDRVELGANACVDRGSWRDTVIGSDTKIDNLVQIGHNAHVGSGCMLCGHVALGASARPSGSAGPQAAWPHAANRSIGGGRVSDVRTGRATSR